MIVYELSLFDSLHSSYFSFNRSFFIEVLVTASFLNSVVVWMVSSFSLISSYFNHYTPCEFFILALADSLSLDSEWQHITSSLQGSFQWCSLDGLSSSSYFRLFQFLSQVFGDSSKCVNYNRYHRHLHVPHLSLFSGKFHSVAWWKIYERASSLFLVNYP